MAEHVTSQGQCRERHEGREGGNARLRCPIPSKHSGDDRRRHLAENRFYLGPLPPIHEFGKRILLSMNHTAVTAEEVEQEAGQKALPSCNPHSVGRDGQGPGK